MASDLDQLSESIVIQNNTVEDVKEMSELEDGSNLQKSDGSYHNVAAVEDEKAGKQSVSDSPVKDGNHESKVTAEEKIYIGQVSAENNSTQFTGSDGISNSNAITKGLNFVSMPELENLEMSMGSKLEKSDQISKTDDSTETNTSKTSCGDSQKSTKATDNIEEEISGDDSKICISSEEDSELIKPSLPGADIELIASTIGYVDEKQYTESDTGDKTPAADKGDKESTPAEKERDDIMQRSFNEFTPVERGNSFDENDSEVGEVEEENNQLKAEASKISSVLLKPAVDERVEYVNDKKGDENCLEEIQPLTEGETTELLLAEDNGKTKSAEIQVQVEDVPLIEHQEGETPKYLSDGRDSGYEGMSTAEPLIETTEQNVQQIPEEMSESRIVNCAEEPELTSEVIEPSPIICQEEYGSKENIIEQIQPVVEEKATELPSIEDSTKTGTSIAPLIAEDNSSMKTGEIQVQIEDIVQIADQEGESLQDLSDEKESVYEGMATAEPSSKTPRTSAKYFSEERSESGVVKSDEPVLVEDDSSMKSAEIQVGDLLVLEDQEGESAQQLSDGKESGYEGMSAAEPVMKIEKQNSRQIPEEISESRILNYAEDEADVTSEPQHSHKEVLEPSLICQEEYDSKEDIIEQIQPLVEETATELPSIEDNTKIGTSIAALIAEDNSSAKTGEIQVQIADQEGESFPNLSDEKESAFEGMATAEPPIETARQSAQNISDEKTESGVVNSVEPVITEDDSSLKSAEIQVQVGNIVLLEDQESELPKYLSGGTNSGYEGMSTAEPVIKTTKQNVQQIPEEISESRILNYAEDEVDVTSEAQHSSQEVLETSQITCQEAYGSKEDTIEEIQPPVEEKATELPSIEESTKAKTNIAPLITEDNSLTKTGETQVQVEDILQKEDQEGKSVEDFSDEKVSGCEVMVTEEPPIETTRQNAQDKIQPLLGEKEAELPSAEESKDNSSTKTDEIQMKVAEQEGESLEDLSDEKESEYEGMANAEPPIEIVKQSAQDKIQLLVEEKAAKVPSAEESTTTGTSIAPLIAEDNSSAKTGEIQVQVEDVLKIADDKGESLQGLSDEKESGYEVMATAELPIETAKQSAQEKIQIRLDEKTTELPSAKGSTTTGTSTAPLIAEDNSSVKTGEIQVQGADQEGESLQYVSDEKESRYEGMASAEPLIEIAEQSAQDKIQLLVEEKEAELPSVEKSTTTAGDNSSAEKGEIQVQVEDILQMADQEGGSLQDLSDEKESAFEGMTSAELPTETAKQSAQDKSQPHVDEKVTELPSAKESTTTGTGTAPLIAEDNSSTKTGEIQVRVADQEGESLQNLSDKKQSGYEGMTSAERSIEITEQGAQDKIQPLVEEKATELPSAKDSTTAETSIAALIAEDNSSEKMDEMQVQVEEILPKVDQEGESLQGFSDDKESGYEGMATAERPIETDMQRAPDKIQSLVEEDATELPLAEENIKTGTAIAPLIVEDNNSTKMGEIQVQLKDILQIADQEGESHDLCYEKVSGYEGMTTIERPIETATQSAHGKIQPLLEEKATELPSAEESPTTGTSSAPPIAEDNSSTKTGEIQVKVADQEGKSLQDLSDEKESGYEAMATAEPPIEKANQSAQDMIQPLVEEKAIELPSAEQSTTIGTGIAPLIAEDISSASTGEIEVQVEDILQIVDQEGESLQDLDDKESGYEIMATVEPPIETVRQSAQKIFEERSESGVVNSVETVIDEDDSSLKSAETQVQIGNIPVLEDQEGKSAQHSSDGKESGYESMSTTEPVITIAKQNARQISKDMLETRVINCAEESDLTNEAQQSSQEVLETSHIIQEEAYSAKEEVGEQTQPLIEAKPTELPTAEKSCETGNSIEQHLIEDNSTVKSAEVQVEVEDMRVIAEQGGVNFTSEAQHSGHEVIEPSEIIYQEVFTADQIQPLIDEKETKIPSTEESNNTGNSIEPIIADETQVQVQDILQLESESPQELSDVKEPGYGSMSTAEQLITESKQNAEQSSEERLESRTVSWEEKDAEASREAQHSTQEVLEPSQITCLEAYSSKEDIGEQIQPPLEEKPTELPSAEESNKTGNSIEQLVAKDNSSMESPECQVQVEDITLLAYQEGKSPQDFSEGKGSGYEGMASAEPQTETARQSAQKLSEERSESGVLNWAKEDVHVTSEAQHPSQDVSEPSKIICPKAYGPKEDTIDSSTEGYNTALIEEKLTDTSSILTECAKTMESEVVEHASIEATTKSCQVDLSTQTVADVDIDESQSCLAEVGEKEMISEMVEKHESSSKSDLHEENIVQKNAIAGLEEHSDMSDKLHVEESIDKEVTETRPSVMQETENKRDIVLSEKSSLYIAETITDVSSCVLPEKKLDGLILEGVKLSDETGLVVDSIQNNLLPQEDYPQNLTEEDEYENIRTPVQYIEKVSESNNEEFETNSKPYQDYQPCVNESDIMKHLEMDETKSDHEEQKHQSSTHGDAAEPDADAQDAITEGSTNLPNDKLKVDEKMETEVSQIEKNMLETAESHDIRDVMSAEKDFENTIAEPSQRRDEANTNRSNNNEDTDACKELDQYRSNEFHAETPGENQIYEEGTSSNTEGNMKTVVVSSEDEFTKICDDNFHDIVNDETTDEKQEAQEDGVPYSINDNALPDQLEELQIDEESKDIRRGAHEHEFQEVVIDQPISEEVERENDIGKYDEMNEEDAVKDKEPKGQEFSQDKIISKIQSQITYPATEALLGQNIGAATDDPEENKSFEIVNDKAQILDVSKAAEIGAEHHIQTYKDCEHEHDNSTERIHAELADGLQDTTQSVIGNSITLTETEKYGNADHDLVVESTDEKPAENFQEIHNVIQDLATEEVDCVTKAEEYPNKDQNFDQSTEDLEHNYNRSIEEDNDGAKNNVQHVLLRAESDIEEMTDNNMQLSERIGTESVDLEVQNYYGKEHEHGECNETTDTEYGRPTEVHSGSGKLDWDITKESRPYSDADNPVTSNDEGTRKSGEDDVHVIEIQDKLSTDYGVSPEEVKSMNVDTDLQQQNESNTTHTGLVTSPVIEALKENIGIATDGSIQNETSEIENDKAYTVEVRKEAGFEAEKNIQTNDDSNHENDSSVEENIQAESADKLQHITKSDVRCESSSIIPEVDDYGTADQRQVVDCKDGKPAEKLQEAHSENQDTTIEHVDFVMDAENSLNKTQNIDRVTKDLEHNNNTQSIAKKDAQNDFHQSTDADVNQEFQDTYVKSVKLNESSGTESGNLEVQKDGREDEKRVCNETDETASVTDTETANSITKKSLYTSEKLDQEKNLLMTNEVPEQDEVATGRRHNPEFVTSNEVSEQDYSALPKEVIYANASSSGIRMDAEVKHDEQPTMAELMTETTPIESQTSNAFKDPERGVKEESIDWKEAAKQESNKHNANVENMEIVIKETNLEKAPQQSNDMKLLDISSVEESQQKDGAEENPSDLEDRDHLASRDYEINMQPTIARESGDESATDIRLYQSVQLEPNDVKQETDSNVTISRTTSHNVDEINPDEVMQTKAKQARGVENFSPTSFASKDTRTIQDNEELNNKKESDPSSENTTQKPYISEPTPREVHAHSDFKPCGDLQYETAAEKPIELETKGSNDPLDGEKTESQSSITSISSEIKSEASPQKKPSKALKVLSQIIHAPDQFHKHARKLLGMKKQSKTPSE